VSQFLSYANVRLDVPSAGHGRWRQDGGFVVPDAKILPTPDEWLLWATDKSNTNYPNHEELRKLQNITFAI
jgi:hypothetical protein